MSGNSIFFPPSLFLLLCDSCVFLSFFLSPLFEPISLESSELLDLDRRVDESVDSDGKSEIGPLRELIEVKHGLMAFFGKVGSSTHGETTFKYLTFGVVGVDWISLGSRIRGENSASALRVCAFQTHAGRVRFRARFPSRWPKPSMEHLSVDRSPKFSSKERKRRLVGGRGGFGLLPLAARLSGYQPIHPSTRPSIAGRQANLSVFQRAETRDQCAFPFRRNFRVENRCRRIGSCGSVADGEEMSATRILYKRIPSEKRGTIDVVSIHLLIHVVHTRGPRWWGRVVHTVTYMYAV